MSADNHSKTAGEYHLLEMRSEDDATRVWLAEQSSIGRQVLVEELRPEHADQQESFLADARAKAAVDHPLVATVYEAVADENGCFFARELLTGHTLAELLQAGGSLTPARFTPMLRRVAEAQVHLESAGHATSALGLEHIHVDEHDVVRLDNLAVAESRDANRSTADITHLGSTLQPLVATARPGTTRVLTLLSWMRGEDVNSPLSWRQVVEVCRQIEQQLGHPAHAAAPTRQMKRRGHRISKTLVAAITLPALVLVFALVWHLRPQESTPATPPDSTQTVVVHAGRHPTPDGHERSLAAFRIATREVSVSEYAEFLDVLETLAASGLERSFDHREQPPEKSSHVPENWRQQLKTPRHLPVTGVDWWDASAFAAWKNARLPTQEEWFAAVCNRSATPPGSPLVHHSVREWTRLPAVDPANPLGGAKWVIIRRAATDAGPVSRDWISDRSLRSADLGFRLCRDAE